MILAFVWAVEVDVAAVTLSLKALSAARVWSFAIYHGQGLC